jgi:hypothetical protein
MNRSPDVELVLRDYFADDSSTAPDHVLDVIEQRIMRQPQQRSWRLPWRLRMNAPVKLAVAASAVIVVAVAGYSLLPARNDVGVVAPNPSASMSTEASPSPSTWPAYIWPGTLDAGTYATRLAWDMPFELVFTVPDGWSGYDIEISRTDKPSQSVEVVLVDNLFRDPCLGVQSEPKVGPSVDDLVTALANVPGLDVTPSAPIDFDRSTRGVELGYTLQRDAGCEPNEFALWDLEADSFLPGVPTGGDRKDLRGQQGQIRVLDVDGVRLVLRATWDTNTTPAERTEVQTVFDSMEIRRTENTPAAEPGSS